MNAIQIMLFFWGIFTAAFVALVIYRGHLTRQETDELFLSEANDYDHSREAEHDDIVRRVNRIQPFMQGAGGLAALVTVAIVGTYVASVLPNVHL